MRIALASILLFVLTSAAEAAIDTKEKRLSIAVLGQPWSGALPTPNASKDQEWRQEIGFLYSGILAGSPSGPTGNLLLRMLQEEYP